MIRPIRSVLLGGWWAFLLLALSIGCGPSPTSSAPAGQAGKEAGGVTRTVKLLNVSYDPTREFYQEFNRSFAAYWQSAHGETVEIEQSHGGAGKQARAVMDGLEADVVTLALAYDIQAIADKTSLLPRDWQKNLPHNSSPYTSTIVFLVRKGNPKQIRDWNDLVRGDVTIVTPNPKTSGGARWNYLAAWGYSLHRSLGGFEKLTADPSSPEVKAAQAEARRFVAEIFRRVPVLDSGARGATNTFVQRELGDVLLTWENEAYLAIDELGEDKIEMVVPSLSILAEPPVAVVAKNCEKHGTTSLATAYLEHLYSPQGQQLAAKHHFRPVIEETVPLEARQQFRPVQLFSIEQVFGGWDKAQSEHFQDGGVFDQIYQPAQ